MKVSEKVRIVYQVLVELTPQKDVAREHRVGRPVVSQLVTKAKRNQNFLRELLDIE